MAIKWYRVPKVGDGRSPMTAFYPMYCRDPFQNPSGVKALRHYDGETTMVVALDLDASEFAAFAARPHVIEVDEP